MIFPINLFFLAYMLHKTLFLIRNKKHTFQLWICLRWKLVPMLSWNIIHCKSLVFKMYSILSFCGMLSRHRYCPSPTRRCSGRPAAAPDRSPLPRTGRRCPGRSLPPGVRAHRCWVGGWVDTCRQPLDRIILPLLFICKVWIEIMS